jgi:hypothetical protein
MPLHRYRSIPLGVVTASAHGQALIDNTPILETREADFKLDTTRPFKINADTNGVCVSFHLAYRETELMFMPRPRAIHTDPPRSHRE